MESKTALVLGGGGITGGMYELGALLFRTDHPGTDLLMIEPSPAESSPFLQQAAVSASRRRFGLKSQQSTVPAQ